MPDIEKLTIAVIPMGAPRQTQRDKWAKRPVIERYHGYRDILNLSTKQYNLPDVLDVRFVIPFPKSYSKRKRTLLSGMPHDQKPDIDNLCKAVMDALKEEDKSVHTIHASKVWGDKGEVIINMERIV